MLSHPRIGILGSLIKDYQTFGLVSTTRLHHFFDLSKNILKYHYRYLRFDALISYYDLLRIRVIQALLYKLG